MNKAFQININDRIYYINQDAYECLDDYIVRLRAAFPGADGAEIVSDIETRISELLDQRISEGRNVIDIEMVSKLIDTVGSPEEISGNEETLPPPFVGVAPPPRPEKKLYRNINDKVFGGVLGGVACYFGWDATLLRVLVVILALTTAVVPFVICYLIAWMVIPPANTPQRQLQMRGEPVTIDALMQDVKKGLRHYTGNTADAVSDGIRSINASGCKQVAANCLSFGAKVVFGAVLVMASLFGCMALIWLLVGLFFSIYGLVAGFDTLSVAMSLSNLHDPIQLLTMCTFSFGALLVCLGLIWGAGVLGFDWKRPSVVAISVTAILFVVTVTAFIISMIYLGNCNINNYMQIW